MVAMSTRKLSGFSPKVLAYRIKLAMRHPNSSMTPEEIVAQALRHKVYVAFSGGRCSTVALHYTKTRDMAEAMGIKNVPR